MTAMPASPNAKATRSDMMLNMPVHRVIPKMAIPTIISMLITSIYNMADTFFVSQIGTSASGAVGVLFSAMAIIQAIAFTFAMGCGTNVSQALGAGDEERAGRFAAVGFFSAFAVSMSASNRALTKQYPSALLSIAVMISDKASSNFACSASFSAFTTSESSS